MLAVLRDTIRASSVRLGRREGASWALVDQAVISGCNFLTIFLLARAMVPADFGLYMLIYPGLLLLTSIQSALITGPHNILAAALEGNEYKGFTGMLALLQLAFAITASALIAVASLAAAQIVAPEVALLLIITAVASVPWLAQDFVRRILYTRSDSRSALGNDAVSYGLQLLGVILIISWHGHAVAPHTAILILGASSLVAVSVGIFQLRSHLSLERTTYTLHKAKTVAAEIWGFGKWTTAQQIYMWFNTTGRGWLLAAFISLELYGGYRAAYHLVYLLNPIRQAASTYLPARTSRIYGTEGMKPLHDWTTAIFALLLLALIPILLLFMLASESLLTFAYQQRYSGLGLEWVITLGALAYAISFLRLPFENAILALRRPKLLFFTSIVAFICLLTLSLPLLYLYGLIGWLIASALAQLAQTGYVIRVYYKLGVHNATQ